MPARHRRPTGSSAIPYRVFTIPVTHGAAAEVELNAFLRSHKILQVDRRLVEQSSTAFWTFCVDYADASAAGGGVVPGRGGSLKPKVDYREVLSADDFVRYAKLRDVRKQIAQTEGVPIYMVFTNEHLAQMVQQRATTQAALDEIAGVGDARAAKYGARMLEFLPTLWSATDAAGAPPV